jgi:hypothetical protein
MPLKALLYRSCLGFVELQSPLLRSFLASLACAFASFKFCPQGFYLFGGEDAGVTGIFILFFVGGGKERGEFGQAQALGFDLGEQVGELALQDFGIGNQFGTPAAGGNGFEVCLEVVNIAGEGAADLVIGEERLRGESFRNAREVAAHLVNI